MIRVAITRAEPEAARTAARVRAMGAEAIVAPLIHIATRTFDRDLTGVQALLFTSANGVRAFGAACDLPVLTVGDATAAAARTAGFTDVHSADGDVHALAALAKATLQPASGALIHICGVHVAGDLTGALAGAGFRAERRIGYEAVAVTELPAAFGQPLDMVMFHSARAAEIFVGFGAPRANQLIAACLSEVVAAAATGSPERRIDWAQIIVAPRPREDALLQAALLPRGASA